MTEGKFITAVNCMDGRVQLPIINYLRSKYSADFVDMITEPGPVKILAEKSPSVLLESIRDRLAISVEKHGSKILAVVAHHDCAGNPVEKSRQMEQLEKAMATIETWGYSITIIGLWVNENWEVEMIG